MICCEQTRKRSGLKSFDPSFILFQTSGPFLACAGLDPSVFSCIIGALQNKKKLDHRKKMKPKINKIGIISSLIILSLISIPGIWAYYFTDWKTDTPFQDTAQRQVIPEFQENSRILDRRIVLKKDKGIFINQSRLVFKGFKDEKIHLDLYLLELDPDAAYPHYISKADARRGIRLGDSRFQLLKVSKGTLQLKIMDLYKS